ncbi:MULTISPECIES: efflux RND transporter periplasmic adaptor subunit [Marichromatium]|uniref:HlyD family secretion protein n=1 Tax=Marichromatium gracile TaxID=1048 RepID=A0A4R4A7N2_MARGR|nr:MULTISPECIES: efflux RND transporter periplasmic adaptor subunit [Marichromatium]MBO8084688.1 efflux RND transporter periplasmic adaptor subunit [Marichromatium sp.]MBK1708585.1 efflux transporter periplasmic adaptor subunit [Marichromatium gracile]RNE89189.1 efflux RND transporter periplasmic adaptor subunit [Marichromatium sp. AB31]RNE93532.1 efflux RND transporter periplasmic adaptor subunit [Marichromatium sp. AB32]TCW34486.1 HlyD family secretion protein [Marichromatium gracile]
MKRPSPSLLLVLALGGALLLWWYISRPGPPRVELVAVSEGAIERLVANTRAGTVKACRRARLAPSLGGQIARLEVHEGDRVGAGELLLELWNRDLVARVELAEREAEAATARARAACLHAEQAGREAERQRRLDTRAMTSEEALDRAQTAARAGAAECEAARANAEVSQAQIGVARAELERTRLVAPFAGVVAEVSGELNEYVTPSPPGIPTPPAIDLIDDACYYISAPIDEVDAARIALGLEARITLDAFGDRVFAGVVRRIAPYVFDQEKQARTVEIEVVMTEPPTDTPLLAGYSADVEIVVERREQVLQLPTAAIQAGLTPSVLLFDPTSGRLQRREIRIGIENWERTEIRSGLAPGDRVARTLGGEDVTDGARIEPAP